MTDGGEQPMADRVERGWNEDGLCDRVVVDCVIECVYVYMV